MVAHGQRQQANCFKDMALLKSAKIAGVGVEIYTTSSRCIEGERLSKAVLRIKVLVITFIQSAGKAFSVFRYLDVKPVSFRVT